MSTPSRANPFGNLDDFTPQPAARPVAAEAIEEIAQASGFPSRKAVSGAAKAASPRATGEKRATPSPATQTARASSPAPVTAPAPATAPVQTAAPSSPRQPRRRTTGRNRQINIKATEDTIEELYRIADTLDLPLGAVLERALEALVRDGKGSAEKA